MFPREIGIKSVILQAKSIQDMICSRMSAKVKGFAAGVIAAVCYGTNPLGTLPLYEEGIHTGSVLFYRYAIALLIFALMMVYRGESFRIKWGHAIRFLCLGSFLPFPPSRFTFLSSTWRRESPQPCFSFIPS